MQAQKDNSIELIQAIVDPRLRLIVQENQGAHVAIDRGLRLARGKYLAILNSDDRFSPNRFERVLEEFNKQSNLALVGSYIDVIDSNGTLLGVKEGYHNLDPWPVPDPTVTFKADQDLRTVLLMQNYWSTTST